MASVTQRSNGTYIVRFLIERDGRRWRKAVTVGSSERQADDVAKHIEDILTTRKLGDTVNPVTATWLAGLSKVMRKRLAAVGLVAHNPNDKSAKPQTSTALTLGKFLADYVVARKDVKPATRINWGHTRRNLLAFFGDGKPIENITAGDAKDFERFLKGDARKVGKETCSVETLSPNTIRKRISNAKQFFNDAVDRELIDRNPFSKLKSAVMGNRSRQFFVTQEMTTKILDACPDAEWRLLVALARYGGLRTPSESLSLKWSDIDWERNRMTVHSPKTEHHEGKESRTVPLFPALRPYLDALYFDESRTGEFVIDRWREAAERTEGGWKNLNLRTHFQRIIVRAGLKPWPKLWQNLRSSRQTELEECFPSHVVCEWIGNSERVARRHYLQVTDAHFERATNGAQENVAIFVATDALQDDAGDCEASKNPQETAVSCGYPPKGWAAQDSNL